MTRILVTGATGNIGRQVVTQLLPTGARIRALTRNPEAADLPLHVEVARGDYTNAENLEAALAGVDTVFLVWVAPMAAAPSVVKQIARSAQRVVLLTSPHKTPHPFFQQPNPMRGMFAELERLIEASGVEWTYVRPGMFAINALSWWAPQIRAGDVVRWPYAAAPTAPIHERDVAAVAVRALVESGHAGAEYVLTGPKSLTQLEQVRTIGEAIGRLLRYEELSPEEAYREIGAPAPVVKMLLDAWGAAIGQPAFLTNTVEAMTGIPARNFREWARDHIREFAS